jgi:outer membrane protein assembly factor BamB
MPGRVPASGIPLAALVAVVVVLVAARAGESCRAERLRGGPERALAPSAAADGAAASSLEWPAIATSPAERGLPTPPSTSMLHGDPRHTDRARGVGPLLAAVAWSAHLGGPIEAQVVASSDEKTLYAASLDGTLTALAASDGSKRWSLALGDRIYGTPCVAPEGTIYVGSDAKHFHAVTPAGVLAWTLATAGEADTSAVLTSDRRVVFAAGATVYAVRPGGDVDWRFEAKGKVFTAPALADDGSVLFGSQDDHVYALTARGALAWSRDLGADVDGAPAIADDGTVVVGTDAGEVVRLRVADGEIVARTQVGGFVRGTLAVARNGDALAGVFGPTPRVVRVGVDGKLRGSFAVPGTGAPEFGVSGAPLEDASGALFFGAQDDRVHALGPGGAWVWSFVTGGDVDAPLTLLSTGQLVAASDDGNVYLFSR